MEQLDGQVKRGEFKVRLPDGRLQVTSYQADDKGFRPKISYEVDPLFVPTPPIIGFTPEKKLIRRPPPRDYEAPELKYLPPTINYDPRAIPQTPGPALLTPSPPAPTPQPSVTYLPPVPPQPSKSYSVPDRSQYQAPPNNYDSRQYHDTTPLINYQPRPAVDSYANYLSPDIYTPSSIERHDIPDEEDHDQQQHYYLVPMRAESGSKPVLALLVKRREKRFS